MGLEGRKGAPRSAAFARRAVAAALASDGAPVLSKHARKRARILRAQNLMLSAAYREQTGRPLI
jgi:hypothetical protein